MNNDEFQSLVLQHFQTVSNELKSLKEGQNEQLSHPLGGGFFSSTFFYLIL